MEWSRQHVVSKSVSSNMELKAHSKIDVKQEILLSDWMHWPHAHRKYCCSTIFQTAVTKQFLYLLLNYTLLQKTSVASEFLDHETCIFVWRDLDAPVLDGMHSVSAEAVEDSYFSTAVRTLHLGSCKGENLCSSVWRSVFFLFFF